MINDIDCLHPLVRRFFELAGTNDARLAKIAAEAGVSPSTIKKWCDGHAPTVTTLGALLGVIGYELKIVRRTKDG